MENGWDNSAAAWIASQGDGGDYGRRFVLDGPMLERVRLQRFRRALDVGCGEGRFCRMLQAEGIATVGIDPTGALIARALELDPLGDYRVLAAESLEERGFDLVVSYVSLIDIADFGTAIARMAAALEPGGTLLIANLNSFNTAALPDGWTRLPDGSRRFCIDHYLEERAEWTEWRGIRIQNWHRPMSAYFNALLANGLELRHFAEPAPVGGDPVRAEWYRRSPYFHVMEWRKPLA